MYNQIQIIVFCFKIFTLFDSIEFSESKHLELDRLCYMLSLPLDDGANMVFAAWWPSRVLTALWLQFGTHTYTYSLLKHSRECDVVISIMRVYFSFFDRNKTNTPVTGLMPYCLACIYVVYCCCYLVSGMFSGCKIASDSHVHFPNIFIRPTLSLLFIWLFF